MTKHKTLFQLFIPIFFETLLSVLAGMVDTLMLSTLNDDAVGAVGTCNTYLALFIISFAIISNGVLTLMTQNIGKHHKGVAYQARQIGLVFNGVIGIAISAVLLFASRQILDLIGVAKALREYSIVYMRLVGGFAFLNAIIPIFSNYLKAFGFAKQPLFAAIIANVVNVGLNALFLFVFHQGVLGVAIATVISKVVQLVIVFVYSCVLVPKNEYTDRTDTKELLSKILKVGLPSALETIVYNTAVMLVVAMLNRMDPDGFNVTARSYASQIINFSFCIGVALGSANGIMTGWRVGANKYDLCKKETRKAGLIGLVLVVGVQTILTIFSPWIMRIFTHNKELIRVITWIMFIDIFLEMGRLTNLVYITALKNAGDAIFTVLMALPFMLILAAGGCYLFGIVLHLNVIGAYIGLALDECGRAIVMIFRWRSGKWMSKSLVKEMTLTSISK